MPRSLSAEQILRSAPGFSLGLQDRWPNGQVDDVRQQASPTREQHPGRSRRPCTIRWHRSVLLYILYHGLGRQKIKGRKQVALDAVFRDAAGNFVGFLGSGGDLAAIEVDGEGDGSLVG
jgi:hypothetical protein